MALDETLTFFAIVFTLSLSAILTFIESRLAWGMRDGILYNMSPKIKAGIDLYAALDAKQ
jgi:hypothetical protein